MSPKCVFLYIGILIWKEESGRDAAALLEQRICSAQQNDCQAFDLLDVRYIHSGRAKNNASHAYGMLLSILLIPLCYPTDSTHAQVCIAACVYTVIKGASVLFQMTALSVKGWRWMRTLMMEETETTTGMTHR